MGRLFRALYVSMHREHSNTKKALVTLALILAVWLLSALLFTLSSEGWNFWIGFYCAFVTYTTIGFGEYVPGDLRHKSMLLMLLVLVGIVFFAELLSICQTVAQNSKKAISGAVKVHALHHESEKEEALQRVPGAPVQPSEVLSQG